MADMPSPPRAWQAFSGVLALAAATFFILWQFTESRLVASDQRVGEASRRAAVLARERQDLAAAQAKLIGEHVFLVRRLIAARTPLQALFSPAYQDVSAQDFTNAIEQKLAILEAEQERLRQISLP